MKEVSINLFNIPQDKTEAVKAILAQETDLVECVFHEMPTDDGKTNLYVIAQSDLSNYQLKNSFLKDISTRIWQEIGDFCPVRVLPQGCVVAGVAGVTGAKKYEIAVSV